MKKYIITNDIEVNESNVRDWIDEFASKIQPNLLNLDLYFEGKDDLGKMDFDSKRIDNKVHVNLAHMIVTNIVAYCLGKPLTYDYKEGYEYAEYIKDLQFKNNENIEDKIIAKDCSKYGLGYELIGVDEDKSIFYKRLDPMHTFKVTDDTILEKDVCAVTYTIIKPKNKSAYKQGVIYTKSEVIEFTYKGSKVTFDSMMPNTAFPNKIPVVMFRNNDELLGDYEPVTELLSAYSKLYSCSFDDFESIANALLLFYNTDLPDEEKKSLNKTRVAALMGDNAKAEYIYKKLDATSFKTLREAIRSDIYGIVNVPDMTDVTAYNKSGQAIRYKVLAMDNKRLEKNAYFEEALRKRWGIVADYSAKKIEINREDIEFHFYSNLPANIEQDLELMNLVEKGGLSLYSALKQMETVTDTDGEYARILKERREKILQTLQDMVGEEITKPYQQDALEDNELTEDE